MARYRQLLVLTTLLAFFVVGLGAFVRLSDAGLGCPDWPGCYGHLVGVPSAPSEHAAALQSFPDKPVDTGKAWKEMAHRYCAGTLGILIFALGVMAWQRRIAPRLSVALVAIVVGQALLGMWTVTRLLKPAIVTAHLLGGMTTFAILVALLERSRTVPAGDSGNRPASGLRRAALAALLMLSFQVALGGWVSSNYAALACGGFPTCNGSWWPETDFSAAFVLTRSPGMASDGGLLPLSALTAIHWTHRIGALLVAMTVCGVALALWRQPTWRGWAVLLLALLATQVGLGILNVLLALPLPLAVAHNLGAALLLAATLTLSLRLYRQAH
jgi:cytochrome c oxidase assembly protein subunit 15